MKHAPAAAGRVVRLARVALLALSVSLAWAALPAQAQTDPYQALIDDAVREFGAGNYVEARSLFEQAHALRPNARTLRALGSCAFELKHYVQASEELAAALQDARNPLTPALANGVTKMLEKARQFVGELRLEIQPEQSRVVIDGQVRTGRRFQLDAGDHLVLASAPGYRSLDLSVSIVGMQTRFAELTLTPIAAEANLDLAVAANSGGDATVSGGGSSEPAPALTERWWFWTMIGILAVGVAVSAVVVASDDGTSSRGTSGVTLHGM